MLLLGMKWSLEMWLVARRGGGGGAVEIGNFLLGQDGSTLGSCYGS